MMPELTISDYRIIIGKKNATETEFIAFHMFYIIGKSQISSTKNFDCVIKKPNKLSLNDNDVIRLRLNKLIKKIFESDNISVIYKETDEYEAECEEIILLTMYLHSVLHSAIKFNATINSPVNSKEDEDELHSNSETLCVSTTRTKIKEVKKIKEAKSKAKFKNNKKIYSKEFTLREYFRIFRDPSNESLAEFNLSKNAYIYSYYDEFDKIVKKYKKKIQEKGDKYLDYLIRDYLYNLYLDMAEFSDEMNNTEIKENYLNIFAVAVAINESYV